MLYKNHYQSYDVVRPVLLDISTWGKDIRMNRGWRRLIYYTQGGWWCDLWQGGESIGWWADCVRGWESLQNFETKDVLFLEDQCGSKLFTMMFHLLDHVCENTSMFCKILFLDAAPYENFNLFWIDHTRDIHRIEQPEWSILQWICSQI